MIIPPPIQTVHRVGLEQPQLQPKTKAKRAPIDGWGNGFLDQPPAIVFTYFIIKRVGFWMIVRTLCDATPEEIMTFRAIIMRRFRRKADEIITITTAETEAEVLERIARGSPGQAQ